MTKYEIITIIISVLALIISIIPQLINLLKKRKIELYIEDYVDLYFNRDGSTLGLNFSLHSKNKDTIVEKVEAVVTSECGNNILKLIWNSIRNCENTWIGTDKNNSIKKIILARPTKIKADTLEFFGIYFKHIDKRKETFDNLIKSNDKAIEELTNSYTKEEYKEISIKDHIENFKADLQYSNIRENLLTEFFWKSGKYKIELKVTDINGEVFRLSRNIQLSSYDETEFRSNIDEIMLNKIFYDNELNTKFYYVTKKLNK